MKRRAAWTAAVALCLVSTPARALDLGPEGGVLSVEVHGFVSQGFILTNGNNYLANDTKHGSFQFSEIGLNFTKQITDRLRAGVQLFAQDLGPTGNYNAKMDWFYLDYRFADWFGVRAGRVKVPFGLYNEVNDIDSARLPVLLPQSVYPLQNRNYLLAQTGGEAYGYVNLRALGALEYRLYGGTIFLDTLTPPGSPYQVQSFNVPYLAGGRLLWETPLQGLRVASSLQTLRLDANLLVGAKPVSVEIPVDLWVASLEYAVQDFLFAAEYSRWYAKSDSSDSSLFPQTPTVVSERGYAMVTYRAAPWIQAGAYYSILFPDTTKRRDRENWQNDVAATLRFDINSNWLLKLEGHHMLGTAVLDPTLNGNMPLANLQRTWGVFLAKATAHF